MPLVTLHNSAHGTAIAIRAAQADPYDAWRALTIDAHAQVPGAARKLRKVVTTLCGRNGCTCGIYCPR